MKKQHLRAVGGGIAASLVAATLAAVPVAQAEPSGDTKDRAWQPRRAAVQLLSFNDYHGHLEATDGPLDETQDPSQTPAGGAEYLATKLRELRDKVGNRKSLTVAAGDLIGGSTFLSGLFHDEPSIETLNAMGLDVSSVGNHEFDEGTRELRRMKRGGCHPTDGCYFPDDPYAGADFDYLAANVIRKKTGKPFMRATKVETVNGVRVGFIGMTLEATPTLVSPAGVSSVDFKDEVRTANRQARVLNKRGVKAIVVLLHEGGYQAGTINGCDGISQPIARIAKRMTAKVDQIITGHTHQGYICKLPDPQGNDRLVTSAASYGQVVTETRLVVNRRTGEVIRDRSRARNHLVVRDKANKRQTRILNKWKAIADPLAARIVGSHSEPILGDSGGNRAIETPMADLVADAILWGTSGNKGGAQVAFMNVGGVREDLPMAPKYAEGSGEITYAEAFDIAPFGNLLNTLDMTGGQIKAVLEQQYQPVPDRGSRPMLALGVSEGFTYTWDDTQPQGSRVVDGSMMLNGQPIDLDATYRVATLSFLAQGGDLFTEFTKGTNLLGGPEDLANLVDYFEANPNLTAPADRVNGL